jgi:hypothetical protein
MPGHVYGLIETYGPITKGYHKFIWETLPVKGKVCEDGKTGPLVYN